MFGKRFIPEWESTVGADVSDILVNDLSWTENKDRIDFTSALALKMVHRSPSVRKKASFSIINESSSIPESIVVETQKFSKPETIANSSSSLSNVSPKKGQQKTSFANTMKVSCWRPAKTMTILYFHCGTLLVKKYFILCIIFF